MGIYEYMTVTAHDYATNIREQDHITDSQENCISNLFVVIVASCTR